MHVATQLFADAFTVEIDGQRADHSTLMPEWTALDRFGVVVTEPLGALGTSLLLQLSIALWYEARPARRGVAPAYPEFVVIHVGGPHGDHSHFDAWPPRKELQVAVGDPLGVLAAINLTGVTRVALPEGPGGDLSGLEVGPSVWAEQASATDRLCSCFMYSPLGQLVDGDVRIASHDPRVRQNIDETLDPMPEIRDILERSESRDSGTVALSVDDVRWARAVLARSSEVSGEDLRRRREIHSTGPDFLQEDLRRITTQEALRRIAGL